ncbi:MAG: acyltransferase family protein [Akkermansia sp.]|nr:acyltransferase family protein [Akkermansia sp.]
MNQKSTKERLFGIDLLRILAMYMICLIHSNAHGNAHTELRINYETFFYFSTWTESFGLIGVNLFAMITGYVCLQRKWKIERYINLWLAVAFYSIFLMLTGIILTKFQVFNYGFSFQDTINIVATLPFGSTYWYFAAYTGLFFFIPFLNDVLLKCSKAQFISLLVVLFILIPFFNLKSNDIYIASGYNFTWLIFLYIGGAYIKRFQIQFNSLTLISLMLLCSIIPLICRLMSIPAPFGYCYHNFILYTFCTFLLLYKIKIRSTKLRTIILRASQISFAVYLIHQHPVGSAIHAEVVHYTLYNYDYPLWFAFAVALCIYIACAPIEYFRIKLFQIVKIQALSQCSANILEKIFRHCVKKVAK